MKKFSVLLICIFSMHVSVANEWVKQLDRQAKKYVNKPAPEVFVVEWLTPEPDLNNKFILYDFWAAWCAPCMWMVPELNALQKRYKGRLEVVGLLPPEHIQKNNQLMAPAMKRIHYSVAVVPNGYQFDNYGITAMPYSVLVDRSGVVQWQGLLGAETSGKLKAKIEELMVE